MTRRKESLVQILEIDLEAVGQVLERIQPLLASADHALLKGVVDALHIAVRLIRERGTTIARLRKLFGLLASEKTADVLGSGDRPAAGLKPASEEAPAAQAPEQTDAGLASSPPPAPATPGEVGDGTGGPVSTADPEKKEGHGRIPASAYEAASRIHVPHESLCPGGACPACCDGRLHRLSKTAPVIRVFGQAPLVGKRWDRDQLRCGDCGMVFTARGPEEAQGEKYAASAAAMMALLRYSTGVPLHRLDGLQRDLQTPVPASTQWDVLNDRVDVILPVYGALVCLAAQGSLVHNDDTYVRLLEFMGKRRAALLKDGELPDPERTGLFTTAIVSIVTAGAIALFFTGRKHAGENLDDLLDQRDRDLPPPVLMSDALSRNVPVRNAVIEANCNAHGRRHFVEEASNFPTECEHVLKTMCRIYKVDELCRVNGLSPEERLRAHQRESAPVMAELKAWMIAQMAEKRVEPNSGLGGAMNYMIKHWSKLTLFLRVPGVPLDNNLCERVLKPAIRQRNASLFYLTQRGAMVGDIYMTLIHTAELHHKNPFDYLTSLLEHAKAIAENPADWFPWTYEETLKRLRANEGCRDSELELAGRCDGSSRGKRTTGPPGDQPTGPPGSQLTGEAGATVGVIGRHCGAASVACGLPPASSTWSSCASN